MVQLFLLSMHKLCGQRTTDGRHKCATKGAIRIGNCTTPSIGETVSGRHRSTQRLCTSRATPLARRALAITLPPIIGLAREPACHGEVRHQCLAFIV